MYFLGLERCLGSDIGVRRSSLQVPLRYLLAKLPLETRIHTELVCRQGCLWKTLLLEWFDKAEMTGSETEDGLPVQI